MNRLFLTAVPLFAVLEIVAHKAFPQHIIVYGRIRNTVTNGMLRRTRWVSAPSRQHAGDREAVLPPGCVHLGGLHGGLLVRLAASFRPITRQVEGQLGGGVLQARAEAALVRAQRSAGTHTASKCDRP